MIDRAKTIFLLQLRHCRLIQVNRRSTVSHLIDVLPFPLLPQ